MRPELQFLHKACAESRKLPLIVPSQQAGEARDEVSLFDFAERHQVLRLFYRWIKTHLGRVSAQGEKHFRVLALTHQHFQIQWVKNWTHRRGALESRGWQVLALKGPALSIQLFGDPLERECWDLDLLVPGISAQVVIHTRFELGYRLGELEKGLNPEQLKAYCQSVPHLSFQQVGRPYRVVILQTWPLGSNKEPGKLAPLVSFSRRHFVTAGTNHGYFSHPYRHMFQQSSLWLKLGGKGRQQCG